MNGNNSSYLIILSIVAIVAIVSLVLINNNKVGIESKNVGGLAVKPSIENKEYQTNNLMIETKLIDKDKLKFIVKGDINQSNEEELRKFYFSAINEFETFLEGDEIFSKIDKKTLINELKKTENMNKYYFATVANAAIEIENNYGLTLKEAIENININHNILGPYSSQLSMMQNTNGAKGFPPSWYGCNNCGGSGHYCLLGICTGGGINIVGCIIEGSRIYLSDGTYKKVEELNIGDKVLSFNEKKNIIEEDKLINIKKNSPNNYYLINNELKVTPEHKIYTKNKGWIAAKELKPNDELLSVNNKIILVKNIQMIKNTNKAIFDLDTQKNNNIFSDNYLIHNLDWTWPKVTGFSFEITINFF